MATYHMETSAPNCEKLNDAIVRFGNPISLLLLNSPSKVFQVSEVEGLIGYKLCQNCAIVIGDPLCLPHQVNELASRFHQHCEENSWKIVYFLTSETFAHLAINNSCKTLLQVGCELDLDPVKFEKKPKFRWKINQSIQTGVSIKELQIPDSSLEENVKSAIQKWQKERKSFQVYLDTLNLLESKLEKRIFYAIQEDEIIGLSVILKIDKGFVATSLLAVGSTVGVTEHLMSYIIDDLASKNCRFLCLGFASGSKIGETIGLNNCFKLFANFGFRLSRQIFHLDEKSAYLHKYHPDSKPTYILASDTLGLAELFAIKNMLTFKI